MKDPVLDQLTDRAPESRSWKTTAFQVLTVMISTTLLFRLIHQIMGVVLMSEVDASLRTTEEVTTIMDVFSKGSFLLLATVIGYWWGKRLAVNVALKSVKIFIIAFVVCFCSSLISSFILSSGNQLPTFQQYILPVILGTCLKAVLFGVIVCAFTYFRRRYLIRSGQMTGD